MSQQNVEIARHWAYVWNSEGVDAWVRLLPSDFEWHDAANLPDARTHRGRDAVGAHLREMVEAGGQFPVDVEEMIDAGDHVFSAIRLHVRGPRSGRGSVSTVVSGHGLPGRVPGPDAQLSGPNASSPSRRPVGVGNSGVEARLVRSDCGAGTRTRFGARSNAPTTCSLRRRC
jgi:ketosteroid isomerase-like protein